jgi:hypothetical protein
MARILQIFCAMDTRGRTRRVVFNLTSPLLVRALPPRKRGSVSQDIDVFFLYNSRTTALRRAELRLR